MAAIAAAFPSFPRAELRTLGLVSIAHTFSHFYGLLLPPIFPLLHADLGVSYTALGGLLLVYAVATAAMQVPVGVLVDRIGGRAVLSVGLALNGLAMVLVGLVPQYWALVLFMMIAGAGNSVFHPADYAILAARIGEGRVGRAFSLHLFAGYVGWMFAPPAVLALTALANWRVAVSALGLAGLAWAALLVLRREDLSDAEKRRQSRAAAATAKAQGRKTGLALLLTPVIAALLLFYVIVGMAGHGIQTFSVVAIMDLYEATLAGANVALTVYFVAAALGTLFGGWVADRVARHDLASALAFIASAMMVAVIGFRAVPLGGVIALMFLTGFFVAIVAPLRDVMVRNAAPPGTIGTAFGIVTTGFSIGMMVSPVLFGWISDLGRPEWVFWATAMITLLGVATLVGVRTARSRPPVAEGSHAGAE